MVFSQRPLMCGIHELLNFPFEMMCSFKCFKNTCSDSTVFKGLILFFKKSPYLVLESERHEPHCKPWADRLLRGMSYIIQSLTVLVLSVPPESCQRLRQSKGWGWVFNNGTYISLVGILFLVHHSITLDTMYSF